MFSGEFMRPEVWHALSVHFPIALLPVATLTVLISFFVKENGRRSWRVAGGMLLLAGSLTAWIAFYTGGIADGIVARKICDPTVLKDHEIAGENMTWLFTSASLLYILFLSNFFKPSIRMAAFYVSFVLMLAGTGFLVYTGHIGASPVYDQGAGVRNHKVDCGEYE
jgi:uncharacterized membrane protein